MDLKGAAALLGMSPESVKEAIEIGVLPQGAVSPVLLAADCLAGGYDVSEDQLSAFVDELEVHEPGRHPPVAVRRALLIEAGFRCAACRDSGHLEYHHIIEFSELQHHDSGHMLPVCGTCHNKMTRGGIDRVTQREIKQRLQEARSMEVRPQEDLLPLRFNWDDLNIVIGGLHDAEVGQATVDDSDTARFDFTASDIDEKNRINRLGQDYFRVMVEKHEPYFHRIDAFLKSPANQEARDIYLDLVDTLRNRIAMMQSRFSSFEQILISLRERTEHALGKRVRGRLALVSAVLSYMYLNCDIGRTS